MMVVGNPAGGDGSDIKGMSNDESESQMSEEVACLMETMHRELEEPSNPESESSKKTKGKKNILFGVRSQYSVCLILQSRREMMQGLDVVL